MSGGRKYRRQRDRWLLRKPGVELAAETRAWVTRMIAAHDDDSVTMAGFVGLGREWAAYMAELPESERVEAACQVGDHAAANILGHRVRTIAVERREAS